MSSISGMGTGKRAQKKESDARSSHNTPISRGQVRVQGLEPRSHFFLHSSLSGRGHFEARPPTVLELLLGLTFQVIPADQGLGVDPQGQPLASRCCHLDSVGFQGQACESLEALDGFC